jgi:hypothetical protein
MDSPTQTLMVSNALITGMWVDDMATELPVGFVVLSPQAKDRDQKAVLDVSSTHIPVTAASSTSGWSTSFPSNSLGMTCSPLYLSPQAKDRDQKAVLDGIHAWLNERIANHKRLRGGVIHPHSSYSRILHVRVVDQLSLQLARNDLQSLVLDQVISAPSMEMGTSPSRIGSRR